MTRGPRGRPIYRQHLRRSRCRAGAVPMVMWALCVLGTPGYGDDSAVVAAFARGNQAYESGRFAEAAEAYRQCMRLGADGADVLYNLGNAYARQEQLGRALAAYTAARRLAPRDSDLLHNIEQVCARRVESGPRVPGSWLSKVVSQAVERRTLNELAAPVLLLVAVSTLLGLAILLRKGPTRRVTAALCGCLVVLLIGVYTVQAKYMREYRHAPAFICAGEATMRSGPGEHFEVTGHLTDGVAVEPLRRSGRWTEVILPTGKRAWVHAQTLAQM